MIRLCRVRNPNLGTAQLIKMARLPGNPQLPMLAGRTIPESGIEVSEGFLRSHLMVARALLDAGVIVAERDGVAVTADTLLGDVRTVPAKRSPAQFVAEVKAVVADVAEVASALSDSLEEAAKSVEEVDSLADMRARNDEGEFVADDPATPDVNEAWEGGEAPEPEVVDDAEEEVPEDDSEEEVPEEAPEKEIPPPPKAPYRMKTAELVDWLEACDYEREDLEDMTRPELIKFAKSEGLY